MNTVQGHRLLIIEDDPLILESLIEELSERGFQVHGLKTPEKVFDIVSSYKPDVLLVDYYLPLEDGVSIKKDLADRNQLRNIRFILMSAHAHVKSIAQGAGIAYLEKPFSISDLISLIYSAPKPAISQIHLLPKSTNLFWEIISFMKTSPDDLH